MATILFLGGVEVYSPYPVAIPDLGGPKGGAKLGQRVEGDGPVAEDAGLAYAGEQEDLLDSGSRSGRRAGGLGEDGTQAEGKDELGAARPIGGVGGDLDEVEELGRGRSDVEVAVWGC